MPESGSERGRAGTRTMIAAILAGTEWTPAQDPQDATLTAREARDLAVRLRPVLSKLAQQPRTGRRRDLDWLPAVEQLAVDAQYFASWWLPRLEGKSAASWPSWSADGYADWVNRLDAQRLRTLDMVRGNAPVTKVVSAMPPAEQDGGSADGPESGAAPAADAKPARRSAPKSAPASVSVAPPVAEPAIEAAAETPEEAAKVTPIRPVPRQAPLRPEAQADILVEPVDDRSALPPQRRPVPKAMAAPTITPLPVASESSGLPGPSGPSGPSRSSGAGAGAGPSRPIGSPGSSGSSGSTPPPPPDDEFPIRMAPQDEPADVGRIVRYGLAAVLFLAGAILVAVAVTNKQGGSTAADATKTPSATSQSASQAPVTAVTKAAGDPGPGTTATASAAPSSAAHTSAAKSSPPAHATTQNAATGVPAGPNGSPGSNGTQAGSGGVTSLSVTQPVPDQTGSFTYRAHVHVTTSGTGPVTVDITTAGSGTSGAPGTIGASTQAHPLSGQTSYDIDLSFDVHGYCPAQYIGIRVTAASGGASPVYRDGTASC